MTLTLSSMRKTVTETLRTWTAVTKTLLLRTWTMVKPLTNPRMDTRGATSEKHRGLVPEVEKEVEIANGTDLESETEDMKDLSISTEKAKTGEIKRSLGLENVARTHLPQQCLNGLRIHMGTGGVLAARRSNITLVKSLGHMMAAKRRGKEKNPAA